MTCTICHRTLAPDEPFAMDEDDRCLCAQCLMSTWTDSLKTGVPAQVIRYVLRHQPFTRADCAGLPRPCPLESCRFNWRGVPPQHTPGAPITNNGVRGCSLDEMDGEPGRWTLDMIGERMGLTRERVRQIEVMALRKVQRGCEKAGISLPDFHSPEAVQCEPTRVEQMKRKRQAYRDRKKAELMRGTA